MTVTSIKDATEYRFKEKGSEFIGLAYPIESEEQVREILSGLKKQHYDAVHYCYACKLYKKSEKYSDDGEPSGTAGIRLLNAINHFGFTNVLIVSVRYFGGIKLGVGPLGKAYYTSGYETLLRAVPFTLRLFRKFRMITGFENVSLVHHIVNQSAGKINNSKYSDMFWAECLIPDENSLEFLRVTTESSSGKIEIVHIEGDYLLPV